MSVQVLQAELSTPKQGSCASAPANRVRRCYAPFFGTERNRNGGKPGSRGVNRGGSGFPNTSTTGDADHTRSAAEFAPNGRPACPNNRFRLIGSRPSDAPKPAAARSIRSIVDTNGCIPSIPFAKRCINGLSNRSHSRRASSAASTAFTYRETAAVKLAADSPRCSNASLRALSAAACNFAPPRPAVFGSTTRLPLT
jgi:hypothetical protein